MKNIFINLKRFDIPKSLGGICLYDDPVKWTYDIIDECIRFGMGKIRDARVVFLFPEALLRFAHDKLKEFSPVERKSIFIGSQGVFRQDVSKGGNFGAFTTNLPASAAINLGADWSMIGHSEERRDKLGVMLAYDGGIDDDFDKKIRADAALGQLINKEVLCALDADMDVLLCIGETTSEKGEGKFEEQKPRIQNVLKHQLMSALDRIGAYLENREIIIGYEPVWAIGPGKTPPGREYIAFVSETVKNITSDILGKALPVIYGGGLKEENAEMIAGIGSLDGGLVALTRFTGDIAFEPEGLFLILKKMGLLED